VIVSGGGFTIWVLIFLSIIISLLLDFGGDLGKPPQ
jgi:hypothetical protein